MRFLSVMLAVTICVFFLAGCDNVKGNKMCEHNWKRAEMREAYAAMFWTSSMTRTDLHS